MTEEEITRNALADPNAQPTDETFWIEAEVKRPEKRVSVMARKTHHVVPDAQGGWNIKKGGAIRVSGHYQRKQDAIDRAKEICRNQGTELVIHKKDGTIERKASRRRDPFPLRDRDTHNEKR